VLSGAPASLLERMPRIARAPGNEKGMAGEGVPAEDGPDSRAVSVEALAIAVPGTSRGGARAVVRAAVARLVTAGEGHEEGHREPSGTGRWRVLERFDHDGHRYAVVMLEERRARPLSPREAEVLARSAAGQTNKEISYELGLAWSTVRVLVHRARRKLALTSLLAERTEELQRGGQRPSPADGNVPEP